MVGCALMFSANLGPARCVRAGIALLISTLLCATLRPLEAQGVARVSYRTREIVFLTAGRAEGVAVGDTVSVLREDGSALASAVVLSVALHTASARLLGPDVPVAVGLGVAFVPRPPDAPADSTGLSPPPDTALAGDTAGYVIAPVADARPGPSRRWRGGIHLEQYGSSDAANTGLRTTQTVGALDLQAPLTSAVTLHVRSTSRYRAGASRDLVGTPALTTIPYQAELRIASAAGAWSLSLGRFVPTGAMGLGYLDGARLDVRVAAAHRLGFVGGLVPKAERLRFSTDTKRVGAYWAFGGSDAFEGTLSAAADWSQGARRRTEVAAQSYWRVTPSVRAHLWTEVDLPVPDGPFTGARLSTFVAGLNADLPAGFRGGVGVQSHQAVPLWDPDAPPDTLPLPGRLTGGTVSLGHDVGRMRLDVTGGALKREGDASPTLRGMLTASLGAVYATASVMHGDLMDYRSLFVRFRVPATALPFSFSIGGSASASSTPGGGTTFWRYSVRPELSWYAGRGLFASAGGDIGTYAGHTTTWLHAGVTYRFH